MPASGRALELMATPAHCRVLLQGRFRRIQYQAQSPGTNPRGIALRRPLLISVRSSLQQWQRLNPLFAHGL